MKETRRSKLGVLNTPLGIYPRFINRMPLYACLPSHRRALCILYPGSGGHVGQPSFKTLPGGNKSPHAAGERQGMQVVRCDGGPRRGRRKTAAAQVTGTRKKLAKVIMVRGRETRSSRLMSDHRALISLQALRQSEDPSQTRHKAAARIRSD